MPRRRRAPARGGEVSSGAWDFVGSAYTERQPANGVTQ